MTDRLKVLAHFDVHLNADHHKDAKSKMVGVLHGVQDVSVYKIVN